MLILSSMENLIVECSLQSFSHIHVLDVMPSSHAKLRKVQR